MRGHRWPWHPAKSDTGLPKRGKDVSTGASKGKNENVSLAQCWVAGRQCVQTRPLWSHRTNNRTVFLLQVSIYTHCLYQPPNLKASLDGSRASLPAHLTSCKAHPGPRGLCTCSVQFRTFYQFLKLCPAQTSHTLAEQLFPGYCPVTSPSEVTHSSFSEMPVHTLGLINPEACMSACVP